MRASLATLLALTVPLALGQGGETGWSEFRPTDLTWFTTSIRQSGDGYIMGVRLTLNKSHENDYFRGWFGLELSDAIGAHIFDEWGVGDTTERHYWDSCHDAVREDPLGVTIAFDYVVPEFTPAGHYVPSMYIAVTSERGDASVDYLHYAERIWTAVPPAIIVPNPIERFIALGNPWSPLIPNSNGDAWFNRPIDAHFEFRAHGSVPEPRVHFFPEEVGRPLDKDRPGSYDSVPPVLSAFSADVDSVDVTAASAELTVELTVKDPQSGFGYATLIIEAADWPEGTETEELWVPDVEPSDRISGSATDGTYRVRIALPHGWPPGTSTISAHLYDYVGNGAAYGSGTWDVIGDVEVPVHPLPGPHDGSMTVVNQGPVDQAPPELRSIVLSQSTVDVTAAERTIQISVQMADDAAGVSGVDLYLAGTYIWSDQLHLSSGDAKNGTYTGILTIPRHLAPGDYTPVIYAWDELGRYTAYAVEADEIDNVLAFPPGVNPRLAVVNSGSVDESPPVLENFSSLSHEIDVTRQEGEFSFSLRATDDIAGISSIWVWLQNNRYHNFVYLDSDSVALVTGDAKDGTYRGTIPIPGLVPSGRYEIEISLQDRLGNYASYRSCRDDYDFEAIPGLNWKNRVITIINDSPRIADTSSYNELAGVLGIDPATAPPFQDNDGDGLQNIVELVLGSPLGDPNPTSSVPQLVRDGDGVFCLRFTLSEQLTVTAQGDWLMVAADAGDGGSLWLRGERASRFGEWELAAPRPVGNNVFDLPMPAGPAGFVRLVVSTAP